MNEDIFGIYEINETFNNMVKAVATEVGGRMKKEKHSKFSSQTKQLIKEQAFKVTTVQDKKINCKIDQ